MTYAAYIRSLDPTADTKAVMDVADARHRYFAEMSEADWRDCIREAGE